VKNKLTIFRLCLGDETKSINIFHLHESWMALLTETDCQQHMFLQHKIFSRWMLIFHDIYKHVQLNPAITFRLLGSCSNRLYKFKIWIGEVWRWENFRFSSSNVIYEKVLIIYIQLQLIRSTTTNSTILVFTYTSYVLVSIKFWQIIKICLKKWIWTQMNYMNALCWMEFQIITSILFLNKTIMENNVNFLLYA